MRMRPLLVGLAVLAILLLVIGWLERSVSPDGSRGSAAPNRLSVSVDNGHTRAREGDVLTYTTRVRNDDPQRHDLTVTQMLPAALQVISTNQSGRVNSREVAWRMTLEPGEERVVQAVAEVGPSKSGYNRLATTSCVGPPGQSPSSCDEDTDPLAVTSTPSPSIGRLLLPAGLVLLLALVAAAVYAIGSGVPADPRTTPTGRPPVAARPGTAARSDGHRRAGVVRRRIGPRKGVLVPTSVEDTRRSWVARVNSAIASRCRAPWPAPSWFVHIRHGKARSPPSSDDRLPFVR